MELRYMLKIENKSPKTSSIYFLLLQKPQRGRKIGFIKGIGYMCYAKIEHTWNNKHGAQGKKLKFISISIFCSSLFQFLHSIVFPKSPSVQHHCHLGKLFDMLFWVLSSQYHSSLKEVILIILVAPEQEIYFFFACTGKSQKVLYFIRALYCLSCTHKYIPARKQNGNMEEGIYMTFCFYCSTSLFAICVCVHTHIQQKK